jgi:hypothetical protein
MNVKKSISRFLLQRMLPRLDASRSALDRLLGQAVRLQVGVVADEDFRQTLENYYSATDPQTLVGEVRFAELRSRLDQPQSYKVPVVRLASDRPDSDRRSRWSPWRRRLSLLHHLDVRLDVLILRAGEQVPPHGHNRVVSGFYLIEGRVACRHYDRVREEDGGVLVRQVFDAVLESGGHTTNSEYHHNIHWLAGRARASYLFRVTCANTPTVTFGNAETTHERVYVDPTGPADAAGLIRARYVTEEAAERLEMNATEVRLMVAP